MIEVASSVSGADPPVRRTRRTDLVLNAVRIRVLEQCLIHGTAAKTLVIAGNPHIVLGGLCEVTTRCVIRRLSLGYCTQAISDFLGDKRFNGFL